MSKKAHKQMYKPLGEDVMPIVAYYMAPDATEFIETNTSFPSMKTDKIYKMTKEAGVNVTLLMNDPVETKPESVEKALELCEKYGLLYLIHSNEVVKRANWHNDSKVDKDAYSLVTVDRFKEFFDKYIHHPACVGWYLWDEPLKEDMEYLGKLIQTWKDYTKAVGEEDKAYYVNLLPFSPWSGNTVPLYKEYLERAVEKGGLDYICYDMYPFVYPKHLNKQLKGATHGVSPGIYNLCCQIRETAMRYDIPWQAFVQMGGNWTEEPDNIGTRRPTPTEILWEVNTYLAFGAKGIHYFTWSQSIAYTWLKYREIGGETGAFNAWGDPTDLYWSAKNANHQVMAVDEYLMHADSTQIITVGELPTGIVEYSYGMTTNKQYKELIDIEGRALIGCFDYKGKTALYVVYNTTDVSYGEIKLSFDKAHIFTLVNRKETKTVNGDSLLLEFEGGEGMLVIIED
jgi:hypothetical protein